MRLILGDCLENLRTIESSSVDAIVTDPPYGLKFMGKKWDYDVPSVEVWRECLRVLKPGAHMLVACGTRTQHRMAVNIEDAGFEIRDVVTWLYGSGFPKSLDVSKAIDKAAGAEREVLGTRIKSNIKGNGENSKLAPGSPEEKIELPITTPATEAAKQWQGWGTALKPATEHWTLAQKPLGEMHSFWYETHKLCQYLLSAFPAELCLKLNPSASGAGLNTAPCSAEESINTLADLYDQTATLPSELATTSSLSIASLWRGILGDLLRHASTFTTETVSSLTIDFRTLNCLMSKITHESTAPNATEANGGGLSASSVESYLRNVSIKLSCIPDIAARSTVGLSPNSEFWTLARKPLGESTVAANVLKHGTGGINVDGCRVEYGQAGPDRPLTTEAAHWGNSSAEGLQKYKAHGRFPANLILDEEAAAMLGEPARFFYVAKASKSERNAGLEHLPTRRGGSEQFDSRWKEGVGEDRMPMNQNHHPTVKPVKLMRYLCRLITPPKGLVLDPFMGSGSTGVAAKAGGFEFVGIEREKEYFEIAQARMKAME